MRILILDSEINKELYKRKLNNFKKTSLYFSDDINAAFEIINNKGIDCILISYTFCDTSAFYKKARKLGYTGDIIILVPGKDKIIKRNYFNGISGILDKGLNGEDFRSQLFSILNRKNTTYYKGAVI